DEDAVFDRVLSFRAEDIEPMITYGTNPGMGIGISETVPTFDQVNQKDLPSYTKALEYMGLDDGQSMLGQQVDYVFIGSCTNSRIEDLREVAAFVKGKKKAPHITAWIVPGSKQVETQAREEGLDRI